MRKSPGGWLASGQREALCRCPYSLHDRVQNKGAVSHDVGKEQSISHREKSPLRRCSSNWAEQCLPNVKPKVCTTSSPCSLHTPSVRTQQTLHALEMSGLPFQLPISGLASVAVKGCRPRSAVTSPSASSTICSAYSWCTAAGLTIACASFSATSFIKTLPLPWCTSGTPSSMASLHR